MSVGRNTASGHLRAASRIGIPERTPNSRASREAVATTARAWVGSPEPPTITGRPRNSGRRSTSTEAKNWSRSTCNNQTPVTGPVSPPGAGSIRAMDQLDRIAADVLGITLRPAQRRALDALTRHGDTLAVLPTGSGKSAIYQVGGLALGGLTVVVSPLIALQRDQLRSMTAHGGVRAVMLNSSQRHADRASALDELTGGRVDFVMLGPEQLANAETMAVLAGS